jgi:predicted small secreted protein
MKTLLKLTLTTITLITLTACNTNEGKGKQNSEHGLINVPPKAQSQTLKTDEDTQPSITLKATDEDNDTIGYRISLKPKHGTLKGKAPNITYIPNKDYNGADSFTFIANDGQADSKEATITLDIKPINDTPIAKDDSTTLDEDTQITIDPLSNDTDVDIVTNQDKLTITKITQPQNAKAKIKDNKIIYIPNPNFNGSDTVTYTIEDKAKSKATAKVNITINPVNDAPVAKEDNATTEQAQAITIDVLGNDSDVDGDALSIQTLSTPKGATVQIKANKILYTPNKTFFGKDTITYTIKDKAGATATAKVNIEVKDVTPPVITLNGESLVKLTMEGNYTELGATAVDNSDGNLGVKISGDFNTSKDGNYTLTYTATDTSGNSAQVVRVVRVYPKVRTLVIAINRNYKELDTTNTNTISLKGGAASNIGIERVECTNQSTNEKIPVMGKSEWSTLKITLKQGDNVLLCEAIANDSTSKANTVRVVTYNPDNDFAGSLSFVENYWFPKELKRIDATLKFASPLPSDTLVTIYEVSPKGEMMATVGNMMDDGKGVDAKSNDGIYSGRFIAEKDQIGTYCYRVGVEKNTKKEYFSDIKCIRVTNKITPQDWDVHERIGLEINRIENEKSDIQTKLDKAYEYLVHHPDVEEVSRDPGLILYRLKSGITVFYKPATPYDSLYLSSPMHDAAMISPYDWQFSPTIPDYDKFWVKIKNNPDIYFKPKKELYNRAKVISIGDGNVHMNDFKDLRGYGFVNIVTHGDALHGLKFMLEFTSAKESLMVPIILTGDKVDASAPQIQKEVSAGRVLIDRLSGTAAITPDFIYAHTHLSPYSIVNLEICRSALLNDPKLAHAFMTKGASSVLAYTDYVDVPYATKTTTELLENLYKGNSIGKAHNDTITKYPHGAVHPSGGVIDPKYILFGDRTLRLDVGTIAPPDNNNSGGNNGGGNNGGNSGEGSDPSSFDYTAACSSIEFPDPIPDDLKSTIDGILSSNASNLIKDVVCPLIDTTVKAYNLQNGGDLPGGGLPGG